MKRAVEIAKSHMLSDVFFSSSFMGEMPWRDTVLYLSNDGKVISGMEIDGKKVGDIMDNLYEHAERVSGLQKKMSLFQVIQIVSQNL